LYETAQRISAKNPGFAKVNDLKEQMKKDAEDLLMNKFPDRIIELENLLRSPTFNIKLGDTHSELNIPRPDPTKYEENNGSGDHQSTKRRRVQDGSSSEFVQVEGTQVLLLPNGTVGLNQIIVDTCGIVKPLILLLIEDCNLLKMWIQFLIPKVEDGNNFGVGIQEDCLAEVRQVEGEAAAFLDQQSRYFVSRGKLVAKVAKYPHVEDFRRSIDEVDEKQFITFRLTVQELRNHYYSIHDLIMKNLEKIKRPRTSNADNMY